MDAARERLFFALLPPPATRAALEHAAAELRSAGTVSGKWLKPEKYHLTLPFLGTFAVVPAGLVERAEAAAATVRAAPFALELDRLDSFARRRQAPCVLHAADAGVEPLRALHAALRAALAAHDVPAETRAYVPHLTLAYGTLARPSRLPAPIAWPVRDFALMRSRIAQGVHERLAQWPLTA